MKNIKKVRFSEEQIVRILKEQEQGLKVGDICRKHGLSEATFYKWKSKYGGLCVSEVGLNPIKVRKPPC